MKRSQSQEAVHHTKKQRMRINTNDHLIKTKIVATLGPASNTEEPLERMIKAGLDVVRLNFSHGTHEEHRNLFNLVRKISAKFDEQVSVICDIQGPKIRTGRMKEKFVLKEGEFIKVTPQKIIGDHNRIQIKYEKILEDLNVDDTIFINDGIIKLRVTEKLKEDLMCIVEAGGLLSDHKGCNIPSGNLSMNVVTPKDAEDLKLIAELNPEFVAASFVGSGSDVQDVRKCLSKNGNNEIKIISKVERPVALENIDDIIEQSDCIMVARGDLGVEIEAWDVPIAQKQIIKKCNAEGKTVIVATQMLESMTTQSRPTRAEASDVFNAVLDGADAVMLSGETSVGKYPAESVGFMDNIVSAAEQKITKRDPNDFDGTHQGITETMGHAAYSISGEFQDLKIGGKIIVIEENSTETTRMVSKYRPNLDILSITSDLRTARELNLCWAVRSIFIHKPLGSSTEERAVAAIKSAHNWDYLKTGEMVLVVQKSRVAVGTMCALYDVASIVETK